mmetsp:Transcript_6376/g.9389  ORF Transcript_6376/g.9389 Transcript_6376/m.9389 type:complete len:236 (+) Transcript_6376:132-839(+)|eukprot:CAMPEP_0194199130 /NCGR_PEP_ID=MMETSP0156-20130528/265_1 /TAXON_ID=33649 /ORGANISM="Thalassionema nitzschioides, Strain L26-B" /LENGTH=235 /DNA_ID=CAMNT_0038923981 /DNA_START=109 /DNA_END=816 /DNA_ORIENTATION=+
MSGNDGKITKITCGTTIEKSVPIVFEFHHDWAPLGVEHAVSLFREGFFDGAPFFRVIKGFLVQFGLVYDKDLQKRLGDTSIPDDPQLDPPIPFAPGIISYAGSGKNSRSSHLFVSYGSAKSLGTMPWETPLGVITSGMETLRSLNGEYGDTPNQGKIRNQGRAYINEEFPNMDHMTTCTIDEQEDGIPMEELVAAFSSTGDKWFFISSAVVGAFICFFVLRKLLKMRGVGETKKN